MVEKCLMFDLYDFPHEIKRSFIACADTVLDNLGWDDQEVVIWPLSVGIELTVQEEEDFNEVYRFMAAEAGRNIQLQNFVVVKVNDN